MVNGRATMNNLRSSCVTLQYTCEDCAGYGNQPISDEEVVSCSTCNGEYFSEEHGITLDDDITNDQMRFLAKTMMRLNDKQLREVDSIDREME